MKKTVFLLLFIPLIFSGCLLQPQITIKSAMVENAEFIKVELHSNKQVNAEVQLSDSSNEILCSQNATLKQGNTDVLIKCSALDSVIKVTVFADGAVFSDEVELSFDEGNLEERVIFLAETKTIEGEAIKIIEKNLAKQNECNAQMYLTNMRKYYEVAGVYSGASSFEIDEIFDNITPEQMSILDEQISETKTCTMEIGKKVTDLGSGKYNVSFSWIGKGECYYSDSGYGPREFEGQKDVVVVEVNLKNDSAKAITGSMVNSYTDEQEAREMIKAFDLIGGCLKAMMLGVNPIAGGVYTTPEQLSSCSSTGGNIEIISFGVEQEYIILHLMNNSDKPIELKSITGSPVELTCYACTATLEPGAYTIFNLYGDFTSYDEIDLELTISYTLNGLDYSEKADCFGPVENFIGEIEKTKEEMEVEVIEINPEDFNQSADINLTIG